MIFHVKQQVAKELPSLVCIHGFMGDVASFKPLTSKYNILSVSLPYHHSSNEGSDSILSYCHKIKDLLDSYKLKKVSFYGYSMGGRVALTFATLYPAYVDHLFIESAHIGFNDESDRDASVIHFAKQLSLFEVDSMATFLETWYSMPLFSKTKQLLSQESMKKKETLNLEEMKQIFSNFHISKQPYCLDLLIEHNIALTYVAGDLDNKYVAMAQSIKDRYPSAKIHIVDDADHAVHICKPNLIAAAI